MESAKTSKHGYLNYAAWDLLWTNKQVRRRRQNHVLFQLTSIGVSDVAGSTNIFSDAKFSTHWYVTGHRSSTGQGRMKATWSALKY